MAVTIPHFPKQMFSVYIIKRVLRKIICLSALVESQSGLLKIWVTIRNPLIPHPAFPPSLSLRFIAQKHIHLRQQLFGSLCLDFCNCGAGVEDYTFRVGKKEGHFGS